MKNLSMCSWTASPVSLVFNIKLFNCSITFQGLNICIVHGDLSINNIVIYCTPSSHLPLNPSKPSGKMGPKELLALQITWASKAAAQAAFIPAPKEGLTKSIPVTGVIIDYDYSCKVDTVMEKTSVHPHYSLNCSVFISICFLLQGTLPFMMLASLDQENHGTYIHSPAQCYAFEYPKI